MFTLLTAFASDPSPALFTPSVGFGEPRTESVGVANLAAIPRLAGIVGVQGVARRERWAAGFELGEDLGGGRAGTVWAGVTLELDDDLRVSPFLRAGTWSQVGVSVAWRTYPAGFRRRGLWIDVSGGPTVDVRRLTEAEWAGPIDAMRSMPEIGLSKQVSDLIHLRLGTVGPVPVFTYRVETPGRTALVYSMTIGGLPGVAVVAGTTVGIARLGDRDRR